MCIFSGEVQEVSHTKVFVAPVYPARVFREENNGQVRRYKKVAGPRMQLTVYSNNVAPSAGHRLPSAMILPFPLRSGKNRVALVDMQDYSSFFDDMSLLFPDKEAASRGQSLLANMTANENSDFLAVHHVGNYKVSIVPNFLHFNRLEHKEFNLTAEVTEILGKFYAKGFGFIVCILKDKGEYHPIGYVHEICDDRLFVPTRHFHQQPAPNPFARYHVGSAPGSLLDQSSRLQKLESALEEDISNAEYSDIVTSEYLHETLMHEDEWMQMQVKRRDIKAVKKSQADHRLDWDHEIYIFNAPHCTRLPYLKNPGFRGQTAQAEKIKNLQVYIDFDRLPSKFMFGGVSQAHRLLVGKLYKYNHDITIPL